MRFHVRFSFLALVLGAVMAVLAPAAAQASLFGVETFAAVNCSEGHEGCAQTPYGPFSIPKEPEEPEALAEGYTVAGGRVPYGVTDFEVKTEGELSKGTQKPIAGKFVKHIRTDVATGLATNPFAVKNLCSTASFDGVTKGEAIPGTGFYFAPECEKEAEIGVNKVTVYAGPEAGDLPLKGTVYDLVPPEATETTKARAAEYGVALELPKPFTEAVLHKAFEEEGHPLKAHPGEEEFLEKQQYYSHTLIEGNVEWGEEAAGTGKGDYHDYFEINVSTALPLIASRLVFYGHSGNGAFITNATSCPGDNTTRLAITDTENEVVYKSFTTPVGLTGCNLVPFEPGFSLSPETTQSDAPDGISAELSIPHDPTKTDNSQLKTATFTLPEGMTLNPSAAAGLTACTPAQAHIHSTTPGTECPSSSEIGTVELEVPTLPAGSLTGKLYLGGPETGAITKPPYIVYLDAESARYGVSVRLKGETTPNQTTGQLTTVFSENPEQPFTKATLKFKGGALAPIANPLACGTFKAASSLVPIANPLTSQGIESAFVIDSNGKGGACASPLAFTPTQGTATSAPNGGAHTNFTFALKRSEGQQYLSQVKTVLPAGLVGAIPIVPLCSEAQAVAESCPAESLIGRAAVKSGSGPSPYSLSGSVYLTGPYNGAPYGLYISVPIVAGPFNLGNSITRATINVDPLTGRVIVSSTLPNIVKGGIVVRLQELLVEINRSNFMSNPTNCGVLATESVVTGLGSPGTSVNLSTPFQVANCGALAFKPSFKAATKANASKKYGASLETTINEPAGGANIKSVMVQLPVQLPSRQETLKRACPVATFETNIAGCKEAIVGSARANTPVLPNKLTGDAYLVSHAGAAFPDLDLVLEADGVHVILVGNIDIKHNITTTTFASTPDVAVSSITVNLPMGVHSLLSPFGNLCARPLVMPTTIYGQNGAPFKQNTIIKTTGCGVQVVGHKVVGNIAYITVRTPVAGRVSGGGSSLASVYRKLAKAEKTATIKVPLSRGGQGRRKPFKVRLRVGFVPKTRSYGASAAFVTVTFR
jgi:hypothetical protein